MDSPLSADGNGTGVDLVSSPVPPCPLASLPLEIHNYIHALQQRIEHLESEQARFMQSLRGGLAFLFENPAMKMFAAAFPKEIKTKIQGVIDGTIPLTPQRNAVTEKTP